MDLTSGDDGDLGQGIDSIKLKKLITVQIYQMQRDLEKRLKDDLEVKFQNMMTQFTKLSVRL